MRFCVPRSVFLDIDVPYIPMNLPDDGFVFELTVNSLSTSKLFVPQRDIRGQPMPLIGSVVDGSSGPPKFGPDTHLRRIAASPASILEPTGNGLLAVFESQKRDHWAVWKPAPGAPLSRASINDRATFVASCQLRDFRQLPRHGIDESKACQRQLFESGYKVNYHFDFANILQLGELDNAVLARVRSWRCKPNGA